MAAQDNPFAITPADPLSTLMVGVQGFDRAQKSAKEAAVVEGRQRAMQKLQAGADPRDAIGELLGIGDDKGAHAIATFAHQQQQQTNADRSFGLRQSEAERAQRNSDRSFGLQQRQLNATLEGARVPPGFQRTDAGLTPIQGGPADPQYINSKQKPREFSVSDVTKLSEEGGKFQNLTGFVDTFEPRFAGYKTEMLGNVATALGRNVPNAVPKDVADAARWWQQYDRSKNIVRNELFGAALTATEKAAFERADINPGMAPETIKDNLAKQREITVNGLKRKANGLIAAGYDPNAIAQAYGLRLEDIGVTATGRRGGAAPAPGPTQTGGAVDWQTYFGGAR